MVCHAFFIHKQDPAVAGFLAFCIRLLDIREKTITNAIFVT